MCRRKRDARVIRRLRESCTTAHQLSLCCFAALEMQFVSRKRQTPLRTCRTRSFPTRPVGRHPFWRRGMSAPDSHADVRSGLRDHIEWRREREGSRATGVEMILGGVEGVAPANDGPAPTELRCTILSARSERCVKARTHVFQLDLTCRIVASLSEGRRWI